LTLEWGIGFPRGTHAIDDVVADVDFTIISSMALISSWQVDIDGDGGIKAGVGIFKSGQ
jgi:hypothetical protein